MPEWEFCVERWPANASSGISWHWRHEGTKSEAFYTYSACIADARAHGLPADYVVPNPDQLMAHAGAERDGENCEEAVHLSRW